MHAWFCRKANIIKAENAGFEWRCPRVYLSTWPFLKSWLKHLYRGPQALTEDKAKDNMTSEYSGGIQ